MGVSAGVAVGVGVGDGGGVGGGAVALVTNHYKVIKIPRQVVGVACDNNFAVSLNFYPNGVVLTAKSSGNYAGAVKSSIKRAVWIEANNSEIRAWLVIPAVTGDNNLPVGLNSY